MRVLRPGERVPQDAPQRHRSSHGYMRLVWYVGWRSYVWAYEHRVGSDGRIVAGEHVHHVNGDKADNGRENLRTLSVQEHMSAHHRVDWHDQAARLYVRGMSCTEVGRAVGRDPATVYRALASNGVSIRSISAGRKLAWQKRKSR